MNTRTISGPGARLRAARESVGLTRRQLAATLEMAEGSLADIENDRHAISLEMIHRVSVAIGCDPHAIDPRLASTRRGRRS